MLWDQNTKMPPGGASPRADQFEAIERIQHGKLTDPGLAKLLEKLEPWAASEDPESDDVALYRVLAKDFHKAIRVPTELAAEMSSCDALAQQKWLEARDRSDFGHFAPALERVLELQQRYIACFDGTGDFAHPYDVLLDDYEPGLTTVEVTTLFATLREELVPLVSAAAAAGEDGRVFPGHYPLERQKPFAYELLHRGRLFARELAVWTPRSTRSRAAWPRPTCG